MAVRRRNEGWEVDVSVDHVRYRKTFHVTRDVARRIESEVRSKLERGDHALDLSAIPFDQYCELHMDYEKVNMSERTAINHRSLIKTIFIPYFGERLMHTITGDMVEQFKKERAKIVKPVTVNQNLALLQTIFERALSRGHVRKNIVKGAPRLRVQKALPQFYSMEEARALLDASRAPGMQPYVYGLVALALFTGMRREELLHLQWTDIDMTRRTVTVQGKEGWHTKNYESRVLPLNDEAMDALSRHPRHFGCPWVFWHHDGARVSHLQHPWRKVQEAAGVRTLKFHALRHTFASHLVMAGEDLRVVQELMGHKNITMTMAYAHLSPGHAAKAVANLRYDVTQASPARIDRKEGTR